MPFARGKTKKNTVEIQPEKVRRHFDFKSMNLRVTQKRVWLMKLGILREIVCHTFGIYIANKKLQYKLDFTKKNVSCLEI